MNQNYVEAFRSFREEFRIYKQTALITRNTELMDQEWLNPAPFGGSGTRDAGSYAASLSLSRSLSSSSQRGTPLLTPSSDSTSAIASRDATTDEEATIENENASDGCLNEADDQETRKDESPVPGIKVPPPRSRKGHKKSRQGCYNCKRRKIKV